jgi:hypothetical protein
MAKNAELRFCAKRFAAMEADVTDAVRKMDDVKAERLRRAVSRLTNTNCWWAEYAVRDIIKIALRIRRSDKRRTPSTRTTVK